MTDNVPSLLEYEYTSNFSAIFTRETASVTSCLLSRRWRPFQELYSYNIEFALGIEPSEKKTGKHRTGRVASPKYVIIHLMVIRHIAMPFFILFSPFYKEEQLFYDFP